MDFTVKRVRQDEEDSLHFYGFRSGFWMVSVVSIKTYCGYRNDIRIYELVLIIAASKVLETHTNQYLVVLRISTIVKHVWFTAAWN